MSIIDRYIVTVFIKIFLICFVSFSGLFVIVDAFTNLEEFLELGEAGGLTGVMLEYYGPRILQFFDRTAPMIALVAAIFSLALMQRSNELTAIAAAGIPKRRIARPILGVTLVLVVLTVANREILIPKFRSHLAMNAQDLARGKGRAIGLTVDHQTGIMIRGQEVMPAAQTIADPVFSLPQDLAGYGAKIRAESGIYQMASEQHPAGYLLSRVARENRTEPHPSQQQEGQTVIFRPSDNDWLEPEQMFIATEIDTLRLAFPRELARYSSLVEMIRHSRQPNTSFSNRHRVDLHARIVQPVFDLTILLIGLPLVISRGERNLFLSAGICLVVVMLMALTVIACHSMGAARIVTPPSLAAWLPLIIFLPVAAVTCRMIDQ